MVEFKRFFLISTSLLLGLFSSQTAFASTSAVQVICRGGMIDDSVLKSLYKLGDDLRARSATLNLTPDCMRDITFPDKPSLPNPFVAALELAAGQSTSEAFAHKLEKTQGDLSGNDTTARALKDAPLVTYLRIGCGSDSVCVTNTLNSIHHFQPEKSPVFCDFAEKPDPTVQEYYQSPDNLPMPLLCLHHSALGGNQAVSALDDWFMAFEKLGK